MQHTAPTLATEGTLNNHIGVPLTLMRLKSQHRYAVIEMGANHHGEIAALTALTKPTVAMVTNAYAVHLEGFGDIAGVGRAKGEIFNGLSEGGIAVLNIDDTQYGYWHTQAQRKQQITFSTKQIADVYAKEISLDKQGHPQFMLCIGDQQRPVTLTLFGQHNVANAIAASACAHSVGIAIDDIQHGLSAAQGVDKRLQKRAGKRGAVLLDDSYNANPTSTKAALDVLVHTPGRRMCIFGEMLELGDNAKQIHADMGDIFRQAGIEQLFTVGELTQYTVKHFGKGAKYFTDRERLLNTVTELLAKDVTVLIKGSKRNRMWEFVQALAVE